MSIRAFFMHLEDARTLACPCMSVHVHARTARTRTDVHGHLPVPQSAQGSTVGQENPEYKLGDCLGESYRNTVRSGASIAIVLHTFFRFQASLIQRVTYFCSFGVPINL